METASLPDLQLASYGRRAVAYLIDVALVMTFFVLATPVAVVLAGSWAVLATLLVIPSYYTLGNGSEGGQTLGKRVTGVAVRREGGESVGYGRALGRWFTMAAINFVPILSLVALVRPLWDAKSRAFHDDVVKTLVVRAR